MSIDNGPAITLLRHAVEHIDRIFAEKDAEYAGIADRNDLTEYGKDHRRSDKRWGERIHEALEGMALKADQLDAAERTTKAPLTNEMIEAAAMEFGKTAYNGYAGPGPRSQFCEGAKWARDFQPLTCEHGNAKAHIVTGPSLGKPQPQLCVGPPRTKS